MQYHFAKQPAQPIYLNSETPIHHCLSAFTNVQYQTFPEIRSQSSLEMELYEA